MIRFPFRSLPGGRRARALPEDATVQETIQYASQSEAQEEIALEEEAKRAKPRKGVTAALEDE